MAETIEDLVREDHERWNDKFNDLEQMAAVFVRGVYIYAARVERNTISVRYGTINRVLYRNNEMVFSISPSDTTMADFTISSRSWKLFSTIQDLFDYETSVLNIEQDEAENTNTEQNS